MKATLNSAQTSSYWMPTFKPADKMTRLAPSFFSNLSSYIPSLSRRNVCIAGAALGVAFLLWRAFYKSDVKPGAGFAETSFPDLIEMRINAKEETTTALDKEITNRFRQMPKEEQVDAICSLDTSIQKAAQQAGGTFSTRKLKLEGIIDTLKLILETNFSCDANNRKWNQSLSDTSKFTSFDIAQALVATGQTISFHGSDLINELKARLKKDANLRPIYEQKIAEWKKKQDPFAKDSLSYKYIQKVIQVYEYLVKEIDSLVKA